MNTFTLVFRNLTQRKFSVFLTGLSVALGVGLIAATLGIKQQVEDNFRQTSVGYEMIVGAKGSPLQLVLHTVYQLGVPVGNMKYDVYAKLKRNPFVSYAIPYALGDNYKGFRIVGTSEDLFTKFSYRPNTKYELAEGAGFTNAESFKAVLGSEAAKSSGLKVGDKFVATHGLQESGAGIGQEHDAMPLEVAGILKRTNTTNDKLIYCTLQTVWDIHEREAHHDDEAESGPTGEREISDDKPALASAPTAKTKLDTHLHADSTANQHEGEAHDEHAEHAEFGQVTAIIVKTKAPIFALQLYKSINDGTDAQAAIPTNEIKSLFDIIGNVDWAFLLITALVIVVALVSVAVAIYNSLNERRREIAILRSLGAHRSTIFSIITLEATLISLVGSLAGILLSKAFVLALGGYIETQTGVEVAVATFNLNELLLIGAVTLTGAAAGMLPALNAYKTDVARNLSPIS